MFSIYFFGLQIVMNTIKGEEYMRKYTFIFAFIVVLATFLAGCTNKDDHTAKKNTGDQMKIYTTVYPLEYFTREIGGKYVDVSSIYPAGVDEHTFEPTQKDIINIADANLFYYIGYNLEGFVNNAKKTLKAENVKMLAVGEQVHLDDLDNHADTEDHSLEDDDHNHGSIDPHLWIDPLYAKQMSTIIKDSLIAEMPEHKETFEANYKSLAEKLDHLNNEYKDMAAKSKNKEFLVSHAAFGYWEKRYNLEQISVSGISTSDEPSQKSLEKLVNTTKKHHLKYILVEQNVSNKLTDIIQKEANLTSLPVHNLANLTEQDIKKDRDYFTIANDNLQSLRKALND